MVDIDIKALGQALDSSWGRSSTPKTASYSVKWKLMGTDRIEASYAAIVNFATERQMIDMKRRYEDESKSVIDAALRVIKASYKELAESTLTTKELSHVDSLEIIGFNVHNPRRNAYYRRKAIFEIG